MAYLDVWTFVMAAGLLGALGLYFLTRGLTSRWLRLVLRWLPPVILLAPAPVPEYDGHFAPAFVVLIFEGLFQSDGQPGTALAILVVAVVVTLGALLVWSFHLHRRLKVSDEADRGEPLTTNPETAGC